MSVGCELRFRSWKVLERRLFHSSGVRDATRAPRSGKWETLRFPFGAISSRCWLSGWASCKMTTTVVESSLTLPLLSASTEHSCVLARPTSRLLC